MLYTHCVLCLSYIYCLPWTALDQPCCQGTNVNRQKCICNLFHLCKPDVFALACMRHFFYMLLYWMLFFCKQLSNITSAYCLINLNIPFSCRNNCSLLKLMVDNLQFVIIERNLSKTPYVEQLPLIQTCDIPIDLTHTLDWKIPC